MIPALEYRTPESLEEALDLLERHGEEAKVLAGGHGLIPALKLRLAAPRVLVDLRRVPGLSSIEPLPEGGDGFVVGALVTHREIEVSPLVRARCPLLAEVAGAIGDAQVRNFGTLAGSLCHADPAADYPAVLLALDAEAVVASRRGERRVSAGELVQGVFETALEPDEIVRSVRFPGPHFAAAAYSKARQAASGFALAGAAAHLKLDGRRATDIAVGITGVAARPFRAAGVEDALRGQELSPEAVEAAVRGLAAGRELTSDIHASAEYRARLAEVHAKRAILRAAERGSAGA
ncbi:MAG: xanthine dehydrogenase family protein subunit M [Planctomycetes bacterium]|nr:xanthine dehydrogenase family protein subunit M [Planctomycetota bacterium]